MAFTTPNSFTEFMDWVRTGAAEPARSNLYSVFCGMPAILRDNQIYEWRKWYEYVNFAADDVTVPSRQVTTAEVKDFGMQRKYATGQVNSPITISFLVTKDLFMRNTFEHWMNEMAGDQENRTAFYDQYTTNILIQKWELGSNIVYQDSSSKRSPKPKSRLNRVTGVWNLYGAFPTNISVMNLNNEQTTLMKMDIEWSYERYRFDTVMTDVGFGPGASDRLIDFSPRNQALDNLGLGAGDSLQSEVNDFGI